MNLMIGGDDDNVYDSVNANGIDAGNDNMNAYVSEVYIGGDTYDDGAAEKNYFAIDHAAYTSDAYNSYVGSNANKDDANDTDNYHANDYTKDGNFVGIDEVHMLLMMGKVNIESSVLKNTCAVQNCIALRRRDIKLEMRMIFSLT